MKIKSDYLQSFLLSRLASHVFGIIDDKQKRYHCFLQWSGNNMTHMAVIMLPVDNVKYDLFCIHEDTTILNVSERFVGTNYERQKKQGA